LSLKVPEFKYYFPKEIIDEILANTRHLLESGAYLSNAKFTEELERNYAEYTGVKHALATSNGTAALELIMRAIDVAGHEVIVPTNTFAATAYSVVHAGGKPVFADIGKDMCVNPDDVKSRINNKTKAIFVVHIGGYVSPRIYELIEIAEKHGIHLVEDSAHAQGSILDGRKAGSFGIAAGFSFFSTKVMTTGEGGMVTTGDDFLVKKMKIIRDQGKSGGGNAVTIMGFNARMSEFQAIVGLAQFKRLEEIIEKRIRVARRYDELLKEIDILERLEIPSNARSNYYKYLVFLPNGRDPEKIREHLRSKYNVRLGGYVYEIPLHKQTIFKEFVTGEFPIAEDLCYRHIALPVYPQMTDEEVLYTVESLKKSLKELGWW
jgi:dTDP-4-amino-4,6-dideoxygalactose transaminase